MQRHLATAPFLDRHDVRALRAGEAKSFPVVAGLYTVILTLLAAVRMASQMPWIAASLVYVIAFVIIGWAQYSIGNGLHEAVHHNLRNRRSDLWACLLTAWPLGLTMAYRSVHMLHHRHLGTEADPDLKLYTAFPRTKGEMLARFLWFVSGLPALMQFFEQQSRTTSVKTSRYVEPLAFVAIQAVIAGLFLAVFGNLLFYVLFWALPIATVGKLLSSTRLLCEHGSPTRPWAVRTISGRRWQTWLLGAFDFNYHGEHHLFPSIPYAGLRRLHERHRSYVREHADYAPFDGRLEFFDGGYLTLLARWFRDLPWRANMVPANPPPPLQLEATECVVCHSTSSRPVAHGQDYLHAASDQVFTFVECEDCRHLYLNPRPKIEEIARVYPPDYATFTDKFSGNGNLLAKVKDAVLVRRFQTLVPKPPAGMKLLDVGCGDAQFLHALRRRYPDAQLDGLDWYFPPNVADELMRASIGALSGTIETVDLGEDVYDVITMNQVIEHVWDVRQVFTACRRALKPGGFLAIETPNREGWDRRFFKDGAWGNYYWPRHLNLFSRSHLVKLAEDGGFDVIRTARLLAPPCWIGSVRVALQRMGFHRLARLFSDTSVPLLAGFATLDRIAMMLGFEMSNQKIIVQKPTE